MAIVAVLAGIVSVAVGGTGETSRDTQAKQDATTVETAAADFFSDQEGAEVLTPLSATVLGQGPFEQIKSSKWPEEYISVAYDNVLTETTTTTVSSVTFLDATGEVSSLTFEELLTNYNAIDIDTLFASGFLSTIPDSGAQLTEDKYSNYLWLLQKTTASGGSSEGAARQMAVFKLVSIQKNEFDDLVDLSYVQLVGEPTETGTVEVEPPSPPALKVVVPNGNESVEGDSTSNTPFNLGSSFIKYQQVYPASQFTAALGGSPGLITQIAFRPDGALGAPFTSVQFTDAEIRLATLPAATPGTLDTDLGTNLVNNLALVFLGTSGNQLPLSSSFASDGATKQFDVVIDLQTPFLYNPVAGNLVLDIRIPASAASTTPFDAVFSGAVTNSQVSTGDPLNETGTPIVGGLVTQFTFAP